MFKGGHTFVIPHGAYYWVLDYSQGLIKRGLAGEVFHWFIPDDQAGLNDQLAVILVLHYLAVFSLALIAARMGVLATLLAEGAGRRTGVALTYGLLLTSPILPAQASLTGYMDPWVFLLTVAGAWVTLRVSHWAGPPFLIASMLLNEGTCFLVFPILVFAVSLAAPGARAGLAATGLLALSVLVTGLLLELHKVPDRTYFEPRWFAQGLGASFVDDLYGLQFHQSVSSALPSIWEMISENRRFFFLALGVAFAIAVVPVITGLLFVHDAGAESRLPGYTGTVFILATLAPLAVLLLAYDYSRFLNWFLFAAWTNLSLLICRIHGKQS